MNSHLRQLVAVFAVLLVAASCGSSDSTEATASSAETQSETTEATGTTEATASTDGVATTNATETAAGEGVDVSLFLDGALAQDVTIEDCTINDTADAGGIWFDGSAVYDIDGQFITDLAATYNDDNWKMYDEDGNVLVTETAEEFEAAARPDVDPDLQNHCVEGALEWLDNGEPITSTVLIPTVPVAADSPAAPRGNLGVTLDGVVIAESAPVDAILSAYTIAAFDDCGGHFNPFEGYHMHGAVGCSEVGDAADGDTPMFGYAMDGYPVHSPIEGADLDSCNGHTTDEAGYHYHANSAEKNQVIECLVGQSVASSAGGR